MIVFVIREREVLVQLMRTEMVDVYSYYCRFGTEFYYINAIGDRKEIGKYLHGVADHVNKCKHTRMTESKAYHIIRKGNRIISRDSVLLSCRFLFNWGTKKNARPAVDNLIGI